MASKSFFEGRVGLRLQHGAAADTAPRGTGALQPTRAAQANRKTGAAGKRPARLNAS
jgi:hypothetical protein